MILGTERKLTKGERESELAALAVGGDDEALGVLLLQYYPMMCRMGFGYSRLTGRFEPEDLANECFAILMRRRLAAFDKTKASFGTWIHLHIRSIIGHLVQETNSAGKSKLNRAVVFSQVCGDDQSGLEGLFAQRAVEDVCLTASIDQLCCRLEPRRARVLKMLSDGHTLEEISVEFGITRSRVKQLKVSAIEELREVYAGCESVDDLPEIPIKKEVNLMYENGQAGSQGVSIATMIATISTDDGLRKLDQEIEEYKSKLERLVMLRKALSKGPKIPKVPKSNTAAVTSGTMESKVEQVISDIRKNGPAKVAAVAARCGLSPIGVGRAISASDKLGKNDREEVVLV